MTVITYHLPECWAPIIVNDDWTSVEPEEVPLIQNFFFNELRDGQYLVLWGDEPQFLRNHDAEFYGWLPDNCLEFMLIEP